jgi:serine/threonine-protein kinase
LNSSDVIAERYRLERLIGSGGMSEVWLAEDLRLRRWVAVKLLREGSEPELGRSIEAEARTVARLQHPNIAGVYDAGTIDGRGYLVMEYVHGLSLREILEQRGQLTPGEAGSYGAQIADALQFAHEHGVVHSDVKPENILVTESGVTKVVDFGIAATLTQTLTPAAAQELLGTLAYLAPEVLQGAAPSPAADVYALGLTVFELAAGRLPFSGATPAAIAGQRLGQPAPRLSEFVPGVPPALEAAVGRAVMLAPEARFPTAGAFGEALRQSRSVATAPIGPVPPIVARRSAPAPTRYTTARIEPVRTDSMGSWSMWAAVGAVLLVAGGLAIAAVALIRNGGRGSSSSPTPTATATQASPTATRPSPTQTPPTPTVEAATPTPVPSPTPSTATVPPTSTPTRGPATPTPTTRPPSPSPSPSVSTTATTTGPTPTRTTGPAVTPTATQRP